MNQPALHFTSRDQTIVEALLFKVRLFSQRQIVDHWWNGQLPNARRRLRRLADHGFLQRINVTARLLPAFDKPLVAWQPKQPAPDFGRIAHRCQSRWQHRPARQCVAWLATKRASNTFGGPSRGQLKHPTQATHDLGVAAVWLQLHHLAPRWADAWRGEDLMAGTRRGQKLPDAFIVDASDQVICVIEFGGSYDTARVREFHHDCVSRNLPYQLW